MTIDNLAHWIGMAVIIVSSVVSTVGLIAIAALFVNEWASSAHRAAMNTYWWSRWIRWHRIARVRKEQRQRKGETKCC